MEADYQNGKLTVPSFVRVALIGEDRVLLIHNGKRKEYKGQKLVGKEVDQIGDTVNLDGLVSWTPYSIVLVSDPGRSFRVDSGVEFRGMNIKPENVPWWLP